VQESPLQISTMPLNDPLTSPRTQPPANGKVGTSKPTENQFLHHSLGHKQPARKSRDWPDDRRAKTSHGNRTRSSEEEDEPAQSPRKRVQSARNDNGGGAKRPNEGQENRVLNLQMDASNPYEVRTESRLSIQSRAHLSDGAEKSPRRRPGSFKRHSALATTLGTSNGSKENFVVRGRSGREETLSKDGGITKTGLAKEKGKALREATGRKSVKGGTNPARFGSQEMEWREKTPRLVSYRSSRLMRTEFSSRLVLF
jgi:hypothetical protein